MRTIVIFSLLTIILLNNLSCKVAKNKGDNHAYYEEDHPVKELYLSSIKAFNQGNLELFLANFASEIRMYGTDGNYFGHNELKDRFEILFKRFPSMKMEIPELTLEILSEKVVMVNFQWKLLPMGQGPAYNGIGSGIYQKQDDKWMEILEVETITNVDEALKQK